MPGTPWETRSFSSRHELTRAVHAERRPGETLADAQTRLAGLDIPQVRVSGEPLPGQSRLVRESDEERERRQERRRRREAERTQRKRDAERARPG